MPAISVIVPVYNVEPWLQDCVDSILAQSFTDYECILVDDGSPDGCPALCDSFASRDSRFKVIHKANGGLSSARNAGLAAAAGDCIAFVDSDDVILPDYLRILYEALQQNDADMSICGVEDVNEQNEPLPEPALTLPVAEGCFGGDELLPQFYSGPSPYYTVAWNKLYRRRLWETLRYPEGRIHEDDAVAHELFHSCRAVACVAPVLYRYRLRSGSICRTDVFKPARFDGVTALVERCRYFAREGLPADLQNQAAAACWHRYLSLCSGAKDSPSPAVLARWAEEQARMRELLPAALRCPLLSAREKLSCALWAGRRLSVSDKKKA